MRRSVAAAALLTLAAGLLASTATAESTTQVRSGAQWAVSAAADVTRLCGGLTPPKPGGGTYTCTFSDDFTGTALDGSKWLVQQTANSGLAPGGACLGTDPSTVVVGGGYLKLTVKKTATPFTCATPTGGFTTQYVGGTVSTWSRFSQAYGRFEVRAAFPSSVVAGLQSALWLYPQRLTYGAWPSSGEIDIAEHYSLYPDRVIPALHYDYDPSTVDPATDTNVVTNTNCMISNVGGMHRYAVEWTTSSITIIYDGVVCMVDRWVPSSPLVAPQPFDQPFVILLTQALGIGANAVTASTKLPAVTKIDYVRAWS